MYKESLHISQYVQMITHGMAVNMGTKLLDKSWAPKIVEFAEELARVTEKRQDELYDEHSKKESQNG